MQFHFDANQISQSTGRFTMSTSGMHRFQWKCVELFRLNSDMTETGRPSRGPQTVVAVQLACRLAIFTTQAAAISRETEKIEPRLKTMQSARNSDPVPQQSAFQSAPQEPTLEASETTATESKPSQKKPTGDTRLYP
jgi:hypothetical protein